ARRRSDRAAAASMIASPGPGAWSTSATASATATPTAPGRAAAPLFAPAPARRPGSGSVRSDRRGEADALERDAAERWSRGAAAERRGGIAQHLRRDDRLVASAVDGVALDAVRADRERHAGALEAVGGEDDRVVARHDQGSQRR